MAFSKKSPISNPSNTGMYAMVELSNTGQHLTKGEYTPIGSSKKLNLLLQRSLRYSYRQRCCGCCPTILCELLFPLVLIALLALVRYGTNALVRELNDNPGKAPPGLDRPLCPYNSSEVKTSSSNELFTKCFAFPPSYKGNIWKSRQDYSNKTNFIFRPITNDTNELVKWARQRFINMSCLDTDVQ